MNFASKFLLSAVLLCGAAGAAYAQPGQVATGQSQAKVTVVAPIDIQKNTDLDFGNIAVGTTAGTVAMTPQGQRTATGGITLPSTSGSPSAASFTVSGQGNYTFTITLPQNPYVIQDGSNNTMTIDNFISDPATTGTLVNGTRVVNVGATLNATANQPVGFYTATTGFEVKVEYN